MALSMPGGEAHVEDVRLRGNGFACHGCRSSVLIISE